MWIADAGDELLAVFFTEGGEVGLEVGRTTGRPPPIETTILTHPLPCEAVGPAIAFGGFFHSAPN